jgi:L-threonylcarbamoyladenylate synthase
MQNDLKVAVDVLKGGGVILYPTDTIWGIGCDATNPEAVSKVYKLKQREDSKSMLVLIENPGWLNLYLDKVPDFAWDLIELTEKPLTIIYPGAKNLAKNLIADDGSIGIRVVKNEFCEQLIRRFGKPIVSTSANISGSSSPKGYHYIDERIITEVDFVIPSTYCSMLNTKPSSIIQLGLKGEVRVIRE